MNEIRDQARFKDAIDGLIRDFAAHLEAAPAPYAGAVDEPPLEHTTRRHFVDRMLSALGWDLSHIEHEIIEEARVHGETTLFLDYLGANPNTRAPLLIFEAKAWAKPMVAISQRAAADESESASFTPGALIAATINHLKSGAPRETSLLTLEWTDWLGKLIDYVKGLHEQSGHVVERVAISSGQWLVIFTNPHDTFVSNGATEEASIHVLRIAEYVERSELVFDCLSRQKLIRDPPFFIRPTQVTAFVASNAVRRIFRALWITRQQSGAHFAVHPQLHLYVGAVIERADGVLVSVVDSHIGQQTIPHDPALLQSHFEAVSRASDALFQTITTELGQLPNLSSVDEFPGFRPAPARNMEAGVIPDPIGAAPALLRSWPKEPNEFLLVTGTATHYLWAEPTLQPCAAHDWGECRVVAQNFGDAPVLSRSIKPVSFFISGESHHCAHRVVHDRREGRCHILPFEEYLCCRACTLQGVCWPGETILALPCGMKSDGGI